MSCIGACWSSPDSLGADGIVAHKDIQSIADLEGKVVALEEGEASTLMFC